MKYTFNLDLTDVDITDFNRNPVVTREFGHDYQKDVIGRATISKDKKTVEVETWEPLPEFYDELSRSFEIVDASNTKRLIELSILFKNNSLLLYPIDKGGN